jgi:hypothetical protein
MRFTHTHAPTGQPCRLIAAHGSYYALIQFGDSTDYHRVTQSELEPLEAPQPAAKPATDTDTGPAPLGAFA